MWFVKFLAALVWLALAFFVGFVDNFFLHLSLIIIRQGYYETGSPYVWLFILPCLSPYILVVWFLFKAWKNVKSTDKQVTEDEVKHAVRVLYR